MKNVINCESDDQIEIISAASMLHQKWKDESR